MTENRHFAGWARTLAGLAALAGLIGLSGCGGGSGAPNNVFDTPGALTLLPNPMTLYSGTPATVTIAGGQPPYTIISSDQSALPVQFNVTGSTVTVLPNTVNAATAVTFTARDARGDSAQSAITINPAPFINSLKLKADGYVDTCPNPTGSANPTDEVVSTFICSGQTGSIAVDLRNVVGGGLAGRLVRFDIVQGAFQIFTELPGQTPTFALTYTVPTDQNGTAVARIRAIPGASHQTAIVQATDVSTGAFVRGTFVIVSVSGANTADLLVLPDTVTITGADNQTCSSGVATTFYIFGGQPPYTIVNTFPQFVLIAPTTVLTSGAGFTVTTNGSCVDPVQIPVTDSAGHTVSVELTNEPGDSPPPTLSSPNPITVTPSPIPLLGCGASTNVVATGGGTVSTTGNTRTVTPATTFLVGVNRPDILTALPADPAAGAPITLTRVNGVDVNATTATTANVSLFVSDGAQTTTISVPVTNDCTP
jgi:hypothetical protein